ncbi:MAG: hypothetical protein U0133_06370 [Gemmatimonadales bacterium]
MLGSTTSRWRSSRPASGPGSATARSAIFKAFNLIGDLTVYESIELPLTYRGMPAAERKQRVMAALEKVGMSHRVKHYPSQLSGGSSSAWRWPGRSRASR